MLALKMKPNVPTKRKRVPDSDSNLDPGQDVGFRVADALSDQIKARSGASRPKVIVTSAIRRGLQQMLFEPQPELSQLAMDAGFTQYHAQLTEAELTQLNTLCDSVVNHGKRKIPMRFVLRECLLRGLRLDD